MFEGDKMLERIVPFAHKIIKEYISTDGTVIDMTAGNGKDTLFLASLAEHVYAFDIQVEAIKNTNRLLLVSKVNNVTTIHDNHINVANYVKEKVQCVVFNLGYLPKGNPSITTTATTTLVALQNVLPLMKKNSIISITLYIGHENGLLESNCIKEYVSKLPSHMYSVLQYSTLNKNNAPYNIFIEKIGEE